MVRASLRVTLHDLLAVGYRTTCSENTFGNKWDVTNCLLITVQEVIK